MRARAYAIREPGAGELNRRILLRKRTDFPVDANTTEPGYSDQTPRWAKIEPVGTAVYSNGVQTDNRITHRVTFRYLAGLDDSYEVVHGSTVYRISRLTDLNGERRFTQLEVEQL